MQRAAWCTVPCTVPRTVPRTVPSLRQVARELEDPFVHPPNEAPLVAVQQSFNARLLCGWDALDGAYASECVPEGMEGLGLRAVTTAGVENLEAAWQQRNEANETAANEALSLTPAPPSKHAPTVGAASAAQQSDGVALVRVRSWGMRGKDPSPSLEPAADPSQRSSRRDLSPDLSSPRRNRDSSSTRGLKVPRGVQVVS